MMLSHKPLFLKQIYVKFKNSNFLEEALNILFTFQTHLLGDKRSQVQVIKGSRQWIEQYIPLEEFAQLFGGYLIWRETETKTSEMPDEGLGVWGKRKVSRFQRILRDRGAVFKLIEEEGHIQQLAIRSNF
jgi:hypothetical protein